MLLKSKFLKVKNLFVSAAPALLIHNNNILLHLNRHLPHPAHRHLPVKRQPLRRQQRQQNHLTKPMLYARQWLAHFTVLPHPMRLLL